MAPGIESGIPGMTAWHFGMLACSTIGEHSLNQKTAGMLDALQCIRPRLERACELEAHPPSMQQDSRRIERTAS
jgi:hypothetical protein